MAGELRGELGADDVDRLAIDVELPGDLLEQGPLLPR